MKRLAIIVASAVLVLALVACSGQKSVFSDEIDDQTGAITIMAENAGKGSALGSSGGIALEESQSLVVSSALEKGSVTIRVLGADGEVIVEATATGTGQELYGFAPGDYSFGATCDAEGTTGTVVVVAVDELIYAQQDGDLDATLALMKTWPKAATAEEAAAGAGFDEFTVPDGDIGLQNGPVNFMSFYCTEGAVEAYGGVGAAELVVYKCTRDANASIPADDTEYKYEWAADADGVEVTCYGNVEERAMKATWSAGGYDYTIMVRGQGDMYDVFGLVLDDVIALVNAIE